jgi:hypothetical protein
MPDGGLEHGEVAVRCADLRPAGQEQPENNRHGHDPSERDEVGYIDVQWPTGLLAASAQTVATPRKPVPIIAIRMRSPHSAANPANGTTSHACSVTMDLR